MGVIGLETKEAAIPNGNDRGGPAGRPEANLVLEAERAVLEVTRHNGTAGSGRQP